MDAVSHQLTVKSNRRAYLEEAIILLLAALLLVACIVNEAHAVTIGGLECDGGAVLQFTPARVDCALMFRDGMEDG